MDINKDILRWVLLLAATPIWLPFLRMLWKDFNRALEDEGGVFGKPPTAQEAERIRREKLSDPEILVSEPWARPGDRQAPRMRQPGARATPGPAGGSRRSGASPAPRDSSAGFRSKSPGSTKPGSTKPGRTGEGGGGFR